MTLQELIELAILDAMGLLDEEEQELFEAAFQSAAPAVQSQVRREQTRLSHIDALLPEVAPPAGLRAMVLKAVREEMARATETDSGELVVPMIIRSRGVSPGWRAASLGLAAAMLVLTVMMVFFQVQHQRARDQFHQDAFFAALSEQLGPRFVRDVLFDRDTQRVLFVASDPAFKGQASVFVNPEWTSAKFFCHAFQTPDGRTYRLAIIDENDVVVGELTSFTSNGGLLSRDIALNYGPGSTLAIIAYRDGPGQSPVVISRGVIGS
jgi:hypothetical protein